MPEYISKHLTEIIVAVIALFAGIAITIRYIKNTNKNSNNTTSYKVNQSRNKVKGDQAGRDIHKG